MITRRKPIRRVSKARAKQNREYTKVKAAYLAAHPLCEACVKFGTVPAKATQLHHVRGRSGKLLCDTRYFMAVDERCHHLIHEHPDIARRLNLIAPNGKWLVQEPL